MSFWKNRKALVTGGAGFIGSHVVEQLVAAGANVRVADNLENGKLINLDAVREDVEFLQLDLRSLDHCRRALRGVEVVLNLAAKVGGIGFNQKHPGTMFRDNVLMNTNILEAARLENVERFLTVSSACVYRRDCSIPTPETEGFIGTPEPTNFGYGWAKRIAEIQAQTYQQEYGMKISIARPYNAYGPRDHFDPEKSHVIPALIKRIYDGENPLIVWGNGEQSRAFLFVDDFAMGLIELIEKYPACDPVNIGTDEEIKIKDLVQLIVQIANKKTSVVFDASKPAGQPRRNADIAKAREKIGYEARVSLREGLERTISWYEKHVAGKAGVEAYV